MALSGQEVREGAQEAGEDREPRDVRYLDGDSDEGEIVFLYP
jgi:hypothetical protein